MNSDQMEPEIIFNDSIKTITPPKEQYQEFIPTDINYFTDGSKNVKGAFGQTRKN